MGLPLSDATKLVLDGKQTQNPQHPKFIPSKVDNLNRLVIIKVSKSSSSPDQCDSVGGVLSHKVKYGWSDSGSRPRPVAGLGLVLVRAHKRGNRSMFLSHMNVSLPLFLPPFLSLKIRKIFFFLS